MRIGFTGTREGMTQQQAELLAKYFNGLNCSVATKDDPVEFHHGACIGADAQAVEAFRREIWPQRRRVVAHPGDLPRFVDAVAVGVSDVKLDARQPLDRNRDIVDGCEELLACPKGPEERRSGTWSTIRYARKCGRRVVIFWPDGTVTEEPAK